MCETKELMNVLHIDSRNKYGLNRKHLMAHSVACMLLSVCYADANDRYGDRTRNGVNNMKLDMNDMTLVCIVRQVEGLYIETLKQQN